MGARRTSRPLAEVILTRIGNLEAMLAKLQQALVAPARSGLPAAPPAPSGWLRADAPEFVPGGGYTDELDFAVPLPSVFAVRPLEFDTPLELKLPEEIAHASKVIQQKRTVHEMTEKVADPALRHALHPEGEEAHDPPPHPLQRQLYLTTMLTKELGMAVSVQEPTLEQEPGAEMTQVRQEQLFAGGAQFQAVETPAVQVAKQIQEAPEDQAVDNTSDVPPVVPELAVQVAKQLAEVPEDISQAPVLAPACVDTAMATEETLYSMIEVERFMQDRVEALLNAKLDRPEEEWERARDLLEKEKEGLKRRAESLIREMEPLKEVLECRRVLAEHPHLVAKIRQQETEAGRWKDVALNLQAEAGLRLHPGTLVAIHGICSAPHLNGQACKVRGFDQQAGRYEVQLAEYVQQRSGMGHEGVEGAREMAFASCRSSPVDLALPLFRETAPPSLRKLLRPDNLQGGEGRWWWDRSEESLRQDVFEAPEVEIGTASSPSESDHGSDDDLM